MDSKNKLTSYLKKDRFFSFIERDWVPIVLFLITIFFKLCFFTDYSLWYDEIFSVFHSQGDFEHINKTSDWDVNPPFYYYILNIWMSFFGKSELSVRFPSLIFNALSISAIYLFSKKYFNLQTAILSSILFFCSNIFFFYSQEARAYSFIFLLFILSSWCFFKLIETGSIKSLIALGVINYMIIASHYIEGIIFLYQGVIVLILFKRELFFKFSLSILITLGLLNTLLERIYEIFLHGGNNIAPNPKLKNIFSVFLSLMNNNIIYFYSLLTLMVIGLFFFIKKKNNKNYKILYAVLIAFSSHIILYLLSYKTPMYMLRYLIFTLPLLYLLIAYLISYIPLQNWLKYVIYLGIFALGFNSLDLDVTKNMDYKNSVPFVKSRQDEHTLILVQTKDMAPLFSYYYDQNIFSQYHDISGSLKAHNIITCNDSTHLMDINFSKYKSVILSSTYEVYVDPNETVLTFLKNRMTLTEKKSDFDAVIVYFFDNIKDQKFLDTQKDEYQDKLQNQIFIIRHNQEWMDQIVSKADRNKISIDSMVTLDAIWMLEQQGITK